MIIIKTTRKTRGCGIKNNSSASKTRASDVPATEKRPIPQSITAIQAKNKLRRFNFPANCGKRETESKPTTVLIVPKIEN